MSQSRWEDFKDLIDNELGAAIFCGVILLATGLYLPLWVFLFSATFGYVAFDAVTSVLLRAGAGYFKIRFGKSSESKGHAFLVLFFGIVGGTAAIYYLTNRLVSLDHTSPVFVIILGTFLAVVAVFVDLEFRYLGGVTVGGD